MSGFYLLALVAIWLFAGKVIYRIWRRWKPVDLKRKIFHITIGVVLFSLWLGGVFWEVAGKKMYWDAKVRELCAKDGGVKVYETVTLPAEMFDKWGMANFYRPTQGENALGTDYLFKNETSFIRNDNPKIWRDQYQLVRRKDGKLLGEAVSYSRQGGDLPGPWHASSFGCPADAGDASLVQKIFITIK